MEALTGRRTRPKGSRKEYFRQRNQRPEIRRANRERLHQYYERKRLGIPCPPKELNPRKCRAVTARTGKLCMRWARVGHTRCARHGGKTVKPFQSLPLSYTKYLGPTLKARVSEIRGTKTHQELLQIYDEVALVRATSIEVIKLASAVIDNDKTTPAAKVEASQMVMVAVQQIADLCHKMASIERLLDDKVSLRQMDVIVEQMMMAVNDELGDDPRIKAISERMAAIRAPLTASETAAVGRVPVQVVYVQEPTRQDAA